MSTPLQQLAEHGQSVWIDYLSRRFVKDGDLKGLVADGVVGVTSNPTIFQGAIAEGDAYDEQIRELSAEHDDPKAIFWLLAKDDIRDACDILRPVFDEGKGKDGWVSLEVDPNLAHDTEAHQVRGRAGCTSSSTARTCSSRSPRRSRASKRSRTRSPSASRSTSR